MKSAIRRLCMGMAVLMVVLMMSSCHHGAGSGNGVPVGNGKECRDISLPAVEAGSEIPFDYCADSAGSTEDGALDFRCSKTFDSNCSEGKCEEQGRGKCISVHDSDRSAGVQVTFNPGTCRADPDKCKDPKKPLRCEGKTNVPAGKKLQCKCDCTHPIIASERGLESGQSGSVEAAAQSLLKR